MLSKFRDIFIILLISFFLLEGTLRLILFTDYIQLPSLQQPWRYTYSDLDDSWKLQYIFTHKKASEPNFNRHHPTLGWSQTNVTDQNPLGLQDDTKTLLNNADNRKKILFYGDSFVKGASDPEFYIPKYMNDRTPGIDIIDLGVPGYGTDQIYLLFKETYLKTKDPVIIIGFLLGDIDRSVLSFRTFQKPYLTVDTNGNLKANGTPIDENQNRYLEEHPPEIKSYVLALISKKLNLFKPDKREEKIQINSRIIESIKSLTDDHDLPLHFVIFYGINSLNRNDDWREIFLKKELKKHEISYFDTKQYLTSYSTQNKLPLTAFYIENEGHHNNLGNKIIAEALLNNLHI